MIHLREGVRSTATRRLAIVATTVGMAVSGMTTALPSAAVAAPDTQGFTALAERYLQDRAGQLLTRAASTSATPAPMGTALASRVSTLDRQLADKRALLARTGLTYQRADVSTTATSVTSNGDQVVLLAHELTELFPPAGSPEPSTAYSVDRQFTFERVGGVWTIVDQRLAETQGIPPITESPDAPRVAAPPDETAPAPGNYGLLGEDYYNGTTSISYADMQEDADGDGAQLVPPQEALGDGNGPIGEDKVSAYGPNGPSIQSDIPPGLCYTCMRDYAWQYWDIYNIAYRDFSANSGGGDCTNFISQIMRKGGWTFDYGWYRSGENWWYNSLNQTYTWAGAENWSWFAPRRTHWLNNVWYMALADVLQMDFTRNGTMDHSMLVTGRSSWNLYLTYHTTDHKNRPLTEILNAYPNAWYYAYRT